MNIHVQFDKFYELVIHLGLSDVSWNNILEQYRGYDLKVMNFVALCEWRQQKYTDMEMTSFKDLYRWCDGYLARLESRKSWVQATVGSNQNIKLVFLTSPLSTYHSLSPR
jgi:hypothetical protein